MAARRRDRERPGQGPGRQPRGGPSEDLVKRAVKMAVKEEIKGVPSGQIVLHLKAMGLNTESARTVYSQVRREVAVKRRRTLWILMIVGGLLIVGALGLVYAMTFAWAPVAYGWWIAAGALAAVGSALLLIGQTGLKRADRPRSPPTGRRRSDKRR